MRYSGSKAKIAKYIIPFIHMELIKDNKSLYVEPFMGGCNLIDKVDWKNKIGNDNNSYVVALWNSIKRGIAIIPSFVNESDYNTMRELARKNASTEKYPDWLIGYVGTSCSYGSAWFNGYARINPIRDENHILEAYNGFNKQIKNFKHISSTKFLNLDYRDIFKIYDRKSKLTNTKCVFYCDPPYANTKGYKEGRFDNNEFWEHVRDYSKKGHTILVSEYNAPNDFKCLWRAERHDGMGSYKVGEKQGVREEKLFIYKG